MNDNSLVAMLKARNLYEVQTMEKVADKWKENPGSYASVILVMHENFEAGFEAGFLAGQASAKGEQVTIAKVA